MTNSRPFTLIAAIVFLIIALIHAYRLMTHFQVVVGTHETPQAASWIGILIAGGLSLMLFRESRR